MALIQLPTRTPTTPATLLNTYPCLACLSKSDLLAVLVLALATAEHYTLPADTNTLLEDSACFTCLSDTQLLQTAVAIIGAAILSDKTVPEIREMIKCLRCANDKQIKAALAFLVAKTFEPVN